ncbi:hypothetical protein Tco_0972407 [Tanacetum coccineum]
MFYCLFMELYELIEENIQSILIGKAEIEDKINENLIKFPNDERLIQMKEMMKEIFKEPYIPEYNSSSESECDDDKDDNSVEEDHRSVFGRHLLMYQNSNAEKILTVTKKATNLKMKWKTKEEKIDCGLYMIMHMELYEGSTAAQWKTGLLPKNDKNHRMQMDKLRSRIAAKILLHEVNIFKKKMSDYATKMTKAGEGGSN